MAIVYRSYVSEKRNSSYRWLFGGKETKCGFLDGASLFYWFLYRERLSNRKLSKDDRLLWHGNSESEVATLTLFALYFNLASVCFYQAPGNSESQTRTTSCAGSRLIHPVKALKDVRQVLGRNALSCIFNTYLYPIIKLPGGYCFDTALWCMSDSVIDKVEQYLADTPGVDIYPRQLLWQVSG